MIKKKVLFLMILGLMVIRCTKPSINPYDKISDKVTFLEKDSQRNGDIAKGKNYLLYGDFVDSGIPLDVFKTTIGVFASSANELDRIGDNASIPFEYTATQAKNGVDIVAPNCFQCHGGYVDGNFIIGLGNTFADFTADQSVASPILDNAVQSFFGKPSAEWTAYEPFSVGVKATGKHLIAKTVGSNPADKLALVLAAHRNGGDLTWLSETNFDIPKEVYAVDVPAWWLLKKKNTMFSTGLGRGDFARVMMASSLLTLTDSTKAREVDQRFIDVKTYIMSLESPQYTGNIDEAKAERGRILFEETCTKCHGKYSGSTEGSYPNYLVEQDLIQTDPYLAKSNRDYTSFIGWYNDSWFSKGPSSAFLQPGDGYIAPPLDGVWATAPYLHNGSVPTLATLLNSDSRPLIWRKSASYQNYDHLEMGLKYTVESNKVDKYTYDTNEISYSNDGHYFSDHLTQSERDDLLEYLKTL